MQLPTHVQASNEDTTFKNKTYLIFHIYISYFVNECQRLYSQNFIQISLVVTSKFSSCVNELT
jgi:hypothetical protein